MASNSKVRSMQPFIADILRKIKVPAIYFINEEYTHQPDNEDNYTLKWDGEWRITYEDVRDLSIAFAAGIVIIYMLIVGWFQNFTTPLVMLAAIPLSLIGIVGGHWMLVLISQPLPWSVSRSCRVMVRNSVLLIDFIDIRLKEGIPPGASDHMEQIRTTPILLTAGAVVLCCYHSFDPIFQGLAISLMGGTITLHFNTIGSAIDILPVALEKYESKTSKMKLLIITSIEEDLKAVSSSWKKQL